MRRVIVVSDTHRDFHTLVRVVQRHPEADMLLHCGDGYHEASYLRNEFPALDCRVVCGNCDYDAPDKAPTALLIEADAARIFFTHGHLYGVKEDLHRVYLAGLSQHANVILYGHTHVAALEYHEGVYLMNPGSLGQPRTEKKTYGIIDIEAESVYCHLADV